MIGSSLSKYDDPTRGLSHNEEWGMANTKAKNLRHRSTVGHNDIISWCSQKQLVSRKRT